MSADAAEEVIAPEPEEVPAEPPARHRDDDAPSGQGTPAGQLAVGAASVLLLGGLGLYNAIGAFGLVAGGGAAAVGAGGYGVYRYRRAHPGRARTRRERATRAPQLGGSRHAFGGSTSRSGRHAVFSAGGRKNAGGAKTTARMPSLGGLGRTGGRADGKRMAFPTGHPTAGSRKDRGPKRHRTENRRADRRRMVSDAAHMVGTPFRATGRAGRAIGRRAAQAGRAARQKAAPRIARAREASRALDAHTGHLASRAGRRIAQGGRRTGRWARAACGWADRRTGQQASTRWAALVARWPWLARRTPTPTPEATAAAPAPTTTAETPTVAPPAPVTRTMPISTALTGVTRRYTPMSHGSPLAAISGEMVASVSRYLPEDMWEVARDLDQLSQLPENVAMALRTMTRNLEVGYPLDQRVVQMLGEFYAAIAQTSAMADQISMAFRKIHADDIKRDEAPRIAERLWNVRR